MRKKRSKHRHKSARGRAKQAHADSLVRDALQIDAAKVKEVSAEARVQLQSTDKSGVVHTRQRGLDLTATASLKQVITEAQKITATAIDLDALTDTTDTNDLRG